MPLADQLVQVGHACLEAGRTFAQPPTPCHLVVLAVASEHELRAIVADAALVGIQCALFFELDDALGYTAACSEPIAGQLRRIFRRLPLWRVPAAGGWARGPPFGSKANRASDFLILAIAV